MLLNGFTAHNKTTFITRNKKDFVQLLETFEPIFTPRKLGGKTIDILPAIGKSESLTGNENSYFMLIIALQLFDYYQKIVIMTFSHFDCVPQR